MVTWQYVALWGRPLCYCSPQWKWVWQPWIRTYKFFVLHLSLNLWMKLYPKISQTRWWIQSTSLFLAKLKGQLLFKEGPCDSWASKHDTSCLALLGSTYWVEFLVGFDGWHMYEGFWGRGMGYLCCYVPPSRWARCSCFSATSDSEFFTTLRTDDKFRCGRATIFIWFKETALELLSHGSQHRLGVLIDTQLPIGNLG